MERTLVAFTTLLFSAGAAHASPPPPTPSTASTIEPFSFVASAPDRAGRRFARQLLPPQPVAASTGRARTRTIYLNRDGVTLRPGINDSRLQTSSIVESPTAITPWEIDDEMWLDTVGCMRELFAPFDVAITDRDPGDVPHLEAVFGGHPRDVGLPDDVAGVSPFTTDCAVIESSVVFTFTDVLPDDARLMCEVMAQEIAHSYGLDHQLLATDPMSYLDYPGERMFQDEDARCGEYAPRPCGIAGYVCRASQNSVALLTERLGPRGAAGDPGHQDHTTPGVAVVGGGCAAGGGDGGLGLPGLGLVGLGLITARVTRRRWCRARTARSP